MFDCRAHLHIGVPEFSKADSVDDDVVDPVMNSFHSTCDLRNSFRTIVIARQSEAKIHSRDMIVGTLRKSLCERLTGFGKVSREILRSTQIGPNTLIK